MKVSRLAKAGVAACAGIAIVAGGAWAAGVTIPGPDGFQQNLKLQSAGNAFFDVYQPPDQYNDDCALGDLGGPIADDVGFSPASDGESDDGSSDLFDGGLVLAVRGGGGTKIFEDPNSRGNKLGQELRTGPDKLRGLAVTRTDRALQSSPTLRSLIALRNPTSSALKRRLIWDSDLGADDSEVVRASSTGDQALSKADRWVAVADDATSPGDAQGTFVLYGKGKKVRKTSVFNSVTNSDSCVSFSMPVKVPPKSTRYILFFTQVHDSDVAINALRNRAKQFNRPSLSSKLLTGIGPKIRGRIVNWNL